MFGVATKRAEIQELQRDVRSRAGATALEIPEGQPPEVGEDWEPDFQIETAMGETDLDAIAEKFRGKYDSGNGISGLWFPVHKRMVMDSRGPVHHNDQWNALVNQRGFTVDDLSPVIPWVWDLYPKYDDGNYIGSGAELDYPRSAGGLFQALHNMDMIDDVVQPRGQAMGLDSIWPVVYTLQLFDAPGETEVRWKHVDPRMRSEVVYREFPLETAYRELDFAGFRPKPLLERDLNMATEP